MTDHAEASSEHGDPEDGDQEEFEVDVAHLSARLHFNPADAHIWLDDKRMMLLHRDAFAVLRQELIERLGEEARLVLARIGATAGTLDAAIAKRASPHAGPLEAFKTGPRLHAIEGVCAPEEIRLEVDAGSRLLMGEWLWRNSIEAEAHVQALGPSSEPVCWTMLGYASAYSSTFMGQPIVYREVECRAMGAPHCRTIAKPAALWDEEGAGASALGLDLTAPQPCGDAAHGQEWLDAEAEAIAGQMTIVKRAARLDEAVLILGEEGVGKARLGRAIHRLSHRASRPLLTVNCLRFDDADLELDLFGRERTGDIPARPGRIERIKGGTLLLEEIHASSPRFQARLLEMLTEGTVERAGGGAPRACDVRVIACATDDLARAVHGGRFRRDLYYRLSLCPVTVPPLRERRGELPGLIRHFAQYHTARYGKKLAGLSLEAMSYLLGYDFPGNGNIVELETMLGRAVISAPEGGSIRIAHLLSNADLNPPAFFRISQSGGLFQPGCAAAPVDLATQAEAMIRGNFNLEAFEEELIRRAVMQAGGNLSKAARLLGITRAQMAYRFSRIKEGADGD